MAALVPLVATIVGIGVAAQVLADRFQVPSVLFLILAGIAVGPEGLGLITRDSFGNALSGIVGLSVAVIVFEAAFRLDIEQIREAPSATFRLVSIGAVIALVGTALAVRVLLSAGWDVAFLIGSLLVATGPTVITPILQIVPVRNRVAVALETEGVINDVTAAILAFVVFEVVVTEQPIFIEIVRLFAQRLGVGVLVGLMIAGVLWYLLAHVDLSPDNAPQNSRLIVLAGALIAYGAANALATEAGIAAVATSGFVLGNADLPHEDTIEEFKGDLSLVVLSFVFITLGALIQFSSLAFIGLRGLGVALAVAVFVRPLIVFVSTAATTGWITFREKLFMSAVSPRGIIPASVVTLFAIELRAQGFEDTAAILAGTVFLVILLTVVFEGGFARHIAESLDIIPMRVLIIGGGRVGRALAVRLEDRGEDVVILDNQQAAVERARGDGHTARVGDGTDIDILQTAGAENAKILAVATGDDDVNLLVAQLAGTTFDIEQVIARVNNPENVDAFEELGVRTISSSLATAWAMDNTIERPALSNWMTELGRDGDVQEIEITAEDVIGRSVDDLGSELPDGSLIALVGRDGDTGIPDGEFRFEHGDHVTILGRKEAVHAALERLHPHE